MPREPVTVPPQYRLDSLQHGEKGLSATNAPPAPQSFPEGGLRGWSTVVGAYVHLNSVTLATKASQFVVSCSPGSSFSFVASGVSPSLTLRQRTLANNSLVTQRRLEFTKVNNIFGERLGCLSSNFRRFLCTALYHQRISLYNIVRDLPSVSPPLIDTCP